MNKGSFGNINGVRILELGYIIICKSLNKVDLIKFQNPKSQIPNPKE